MHDDDDDDALRSELTTLLLHYFTVNVSEQQGLSNHIR